MRWLILWLLIKARNFLEAGEAVSLVLKHLYLSNACQSFFHVLFLSLLLACLSANILTLIFWTYLGRSLVSELCPSAAFFASLSTFLLP